MGPLEFTDEEFALLNKYKAESYAKLMDFSNLKMSDEKKLYAIADIIVHMLNIVKSADAKLFLYILNKINKGVQNDTVN